ncbi:MAG: fumarate reductase subunit D [Chloroflexi bacterium]|nr:fumarate reductase subunit D [Chloroflexota bacterium]
MRKSNEPVLWFLFGAGGVLAAFLAPIQIALTGIAGPAGWLGSSFEYERVLALVSHPVTKLYLLVLITLPLFHWAHRFRFTVVDLGLRASKRAIAVTFYGVAAIGSILSVLVLLRL